MPIPPRPVDAHSTASSTTPPGGAHTAFPMLAGVEGTRAARQIRTSGAPHAGYSALTDYPLGVGKRSPSRRTSRRRARPVALAAAPFVTGEFKKGPRYWFPHVALALFEFASLAVSDPTGCGDFHGDVEAVREPTSRTRTRRSTTAGRRRARRLRIRARASSGSRCRLRVGRGRLSGEVELREHRAVIGAWGVPAPRRELGDRGRRLPGGVRADDPPHQRVADQDVIDRARGGPGDSRENRCASGIRAARFHSCLRSPWSGWSNPPVPISDPGGP